MKYIMLLFCLSLFSPDQLGEIRKRYMDAAHSEEKAMRFAEIVSGIRHDDRNKVLVAYKGCALTLKSKYSDSLTDKISFMKEGAGLIDGAAQADPNNIEIRMVRLSVQESVPFIVNYRSNRDEDKAFIQSHFASTPKALREFIRNFILQSSSFTDEEKAAYR